MGPARASAKKITDSRASGLPGRVSTMCFPEARGPRPWNRRDHYHLGAALAPRPSLRASGSAQTDPRTGLGADRLLSTPALGAVGAGGGAYRARAARAPTAPERVRDLPTAARMHQPRGQGER